METATRLAAEGGYEAVQMRDVAGHAGVALGTLYRHFPSKDELLLAALAEQIETLRARSEQRPATGDTPSERVADVLRRACRALQRRPELTAALITAMTSTGDAPGKIGVHDGFSAIISGALGDHHVENLDAIQRVLGHVWFSSLVAWVGGTTPAGRMGDDLESAARLLLP
ncbi:MAG: TetR family transcriptional regulator [Acidimicrobiia bacterium]|nr:TetR family transcriptional regulator [Acidimicrobiia bacterium]